MFTDNSKSSQLRMCILLVSDKPSQEGAMGRAARALIEALRDQGVEVTVSADAEDGEAVIASDPHLQAVILDWDLPTPGGERGSAGAGVMLRDLRARNEAVPVFLLAERSDAAHLPEEVLARADEFIWLLEDTPAFIGERVVAAIERYRSGLLPPMFRALVKFAKEAEYSWHTPGHTGGTAFLRSPVGRIFHDYFGEALLRSDLSISVGELGSLLDHSGPIGDGEKYAAHVFGADRTYYVTNGTSTSNRVVMMGTVARDQLVVVDRNCHKSVEHGLSLTGALPVYLMPQRNHLGLIGPIPAAAFNPQAVARKIAARASSFAQKPERPALAVLTNSTYDGLCYDVTRVEQLLGSSVDRVLFDEAWFAYARFNPIYAGRHAMRGSPAEFDREGPTIFATQSTHKLLAALSQASMIHLREGRVRVDPLCFNEAFMMHASTSPQYAIIASNDVSAAMMDGNGGSRLTSEAIAEAVSFRQTLGRLHEEYRSRGDWFFNVWQPDEVRDGASRLRFHEAPTEMLQERQDCWLLEPGAAWHGFADLVPGYCMLDPIKVTVITPGIGPRGELAETGIPAPLLSAYLAEHGIVVEKTANFSILLLFSIGVTKGKWGSLISALMEFKRDYEANAPLIRVMPALAAAHPAVYATQGLKDLAQAMFTTMCAEAMPQSLDAAFRDEPLPIFTPAQAYDRLVRGEASRSDLAGLASNIAATAIVPYPPGIPLLMPGEYFGKADGSVMRYLSSLRVFDRLFPGFGHDTHGIEAEAGEFYGLCLRN